MRFRCGARGPASTICVRVRWHQRWPFYRTFGSAWHMGPRTVWAHPLNPGLIIQAGPVMWVAR